MGKINEGAVIIILLALAVFALYGQNNNQQAPPASTDNSGNSGGGIDLCKLVDGQVSFTGQRMFLTGTALTAEYARVIRQGSIMDLGQTSLNSGTLSTTPNAKYNIYYGENSTIYYTTKEVYTSPCQDAPDNKVGVLCANSTPTITIFDENGQVQSGTTNAQAMGANDIVDVEIKVKVPADSCYGNPQSSKKNAICFGYNGTVFDSVKANTPSSSIPYSVGSDAMKLTGYSQACYELNLLKDTESQTLTVTLDASATQPVGTGHAINISLEDVDFDLNQDTLAEIDGFEDESNNNLGTPLFRVAGIQVS